MSSIWYTIDWLGDERFSGWPTNCLANGPKRFNLQIYFMFISTEWTGHVWLFSSYCCLNFVQYLSLCKTVVDICLSADKPDKMSVLCGAGRHKLTKSQALRIGCRKQRISKLLWVRSRFDWKSIFLELFPKSCLQCNA